MTNKQFGHPADSSAVHAAALYLSVTSRSESMAWADEHLDQIIGILTYAAHQWSKERLEETATLIDGSRVTAGRSFRENVGHVRAGRFWLAVKVWRAISGKRRAPRGQRE